MKIVYWFNEIDKNSLSIAGGKGANLGEMTQAGFPVPPGFIVSAQAYYQFMEQTNLAALVKVKTDGLDPEDSKTLQQTSQEIKDAILEQDVPSDIRAEIIRAYNKLGGASLIPSSENEVLVAVRSSATAEDLPSISGQEQAVAMVNGEQVYTTMENLWNIYAGNNVALQVPSLEKNKIKWMEAGMYRHHAKCKLYKITTRSGRSITITPDHSLVALNPDTLKLETIRVHDVTSDTRIPVLKKLPATTQKRETSMLDVAATLNGDELVIDEKGIRIRRGKWSIQKPFPKTIPINKDFAYFLGVYAAEGSTYDINCVDVSCESREITARLKTYFKNIGLGTSKNEKNIRAFSQTLVKLLQKSFGDPLPIKGKGKSARIKQVPQLVFKQNKEFIAEFIKGYFDGDGYVSRREISAVTASKDLANGLAYLLASLGIKCYLRTKKQYFIISVPQSEAKKFYEKIGATEEKDKAKLEKMVEEYAIRKKHQDFIETLPPSQKVSEIIGEEIRKDLPKKQIKAVICPTTCGGEMRRNGKSSSEKQRYMCSTCGKSFSEGIFEKIERDVETTSDLDEKGRFKKGSIPWNMGDRVPQTYGYGYLNAIAGKLGSKQLKKIAESDVIWDAVEKIEEVDYNGYVYDFTVPGTENFLAGFGGVITHNTASFAGQQSTYLNIQGQDDVVEAVKKCWASLFEARAIYYRQDKGFDHNKVGLAAVVQKMVQSEKSGVMFTVDPMSNDRGKIVIEAGFGLGEAIVSGSISPDHYVVDKRTGEITDKKIFKQDRMVVRVGKVTREEDVPEEMQENQKLSDEEIKEVAEYGKKIEQHYGSPQDVEWAVEDSKVYIVQTRAVTTLNTQAKEGSEVEVKDANILLRGLGAAPGIATGTVKILASAKELDKVQKGDILVAKMTSPDFVPAMKRALGIVTDEGGMTCHAAIVSRELGIPCVVGAGKATSTLKEGQTITIDAKRGVIFEGKVQLESSKTEQTSASSPGQVVTGTKIYVNLAEPDICDRVASKNVDGVGLLRAEFMIAGLGVHPRKLIEEKRQKEFIDALANGLRKVCSEFFPRPVIYRATDFKTNEYRNLEGGEKYEPKEENPMIGFRGCYRYIKDPEVFNMELAAIKKVREEYGLFNLWLMIPFVRTLHEYKLCKRLVKKSGLNQNKDFKLGIMCEVPSTAILAEDFCRLGVDFMSIGSNDLTQLTLGLDRDSSLVAELFDERDPAVIKSIERVIKACRKYGVKVSCCGQAPSVYSEFAEALVRFGIDSVSVNPDVIDVTRKIVASAEQKIMLERLRAQTPATDEDDD
ncbi:phosphoenolpyruvate synthase [Candidatus Micrarchaeota archaeon]|nr:phosphoenolpyruvate synthase [Candidatus Micrarchaeota archaeon]